MTRGPPNPSKSTTVGSTTKATRSLYWKGVILKVSISSSSEKDRTVFFGRRCMAASSGVVCHDSMHLGSMTDTTLVTLDRFPNLFATFGFLFRALSIQTFAPVLRSTWSGSVLFFSLGFRRHVGFLRRRLSLYVSVFQLHEHWSPCKRWLVRVAAPLLGLCWRMVVGLGMTFPSFFQGNPGWSGSVVPFPVFLPGVPSNRGQGSGSTPWFCFLFVVQSIRWRRKRKDRSKVHRNQETTPHNTLDQRDDPCRIEKGAIPMCMGQAGMGWVHRMSRVSLSQPTDPDGTLHPTNHAKTYETRRNETHHGRRFPALRRPTARWMEVHGRTRSRS